jgi:hypothetical protein
MALTVAQLREHVTSSLADTALQRLLDDAYAAIAEAIGASGDVDESHRAGNGPLLMLAHAASAIVSVTEDATGTAVALDPDDYFLRPSGSLLERLATGPNPRSYWGGRVDLTLTPRLAEAQRDRVAIELVKLEITSNPGIASQRIGPWTETYAQGGGDTEGESGYAAQRAAILATLDNEMVVF